MALSQQNSRKQIRAVILGLYSSKYPAIGESHGLSVAAGELRSAFSPGEFSMRVIDMMQWGEESVARAARVIADTQANVIAVGMPYGTFSVLKRYYAELRSALRENNPLIILGGPIATYMSEQILSEIAPEAIVIRGEAEGVLPDLVRRWQNGVSLADLPNLHYRDNLPGGTRKTPRKLADLSVASAPYRGHISAIHEAGGQIFCETSRGCSWAACTFCLRGLTDVAGRNFEYRRKDQDILMADFAALNDLGISEVTFADEDFLGPTLDGAESLALGLREADVPLPRFDASLTVHSVLSRRDSHEQAGRRNRMLGRLAGIGLQKAFLGIESCSPSQLKRYAKGHTREEAALAVSRLQHLGIRVEIGVILFDPLCSLNEVRDSLHFMRRHNLVGLASGLSNELRLQTDSHYLAMLGNYEQQNGRQLRAQGLDPDTLSYTYTFDDPQVAQFFGEVSEWNRRLHHLYYPAKSLSRYGSTGAIGAQANALRTGVAKFRDAMCDALIDAIDELMTHGTSGASLGISLPVITHELADCVIACLLPLDEAHSRHPVVQQALEAARRISAKTNSRPSVRRGIY